MVSSVCVCGGAAFMSGEGDITILVFEWFNGSTLKVNQGHLCFLKVNSMTPKRKYLNSFSYSQQTILKE